MSKEKSGKFKETIKILKKQKLLHFMILPVIVWFIIFKYIPMYGVLMAFKDFNIRLGLLKSEWVGFYYFITFFKSIYAFRLIKNDLLISIYSIVFAFWPPIVLALMLNEVKNLTYKKIVQTISYLPHFISLAAMVSLLYLLLSPQDGIINRILVDVFKMEPIWFLGRPEWFRPVYIASGIWQGVGWGAIIYIAAISQINPESYDAAIIDGASKFQRAIYITIPLIKPTIAILLILSIGGLMGTGAAKIILMYNPLTYVTADVLGSFVYRRGLLEANYSYGAAVGLFSSVVNITLLLTANFLSRKFLQQSLF